MELSRIKFKSEEVEKNFKTRGKYQNSYCREWIKVKDHHGSKGSVRIKKQTITAEQVDMDF